MGLLSVCIWLPIAFGAYLLATGRDPPAAALLFRRMKADAGAHWPAPPLGAAPAARLLADWLADVAHDEQWRREWIGKLSSNPQVYVEAEDAVIAEGTALFASFAKAAGAPPARLTTTWWRSTKTRSCSTAAGRSAGPWPCSPSRS
jgi:hypothetical protein